MDLRVLFVEGGGVDFVVAVVGHVVVVVVADGRRVLEVFGEGGEDLGAA